MWNALRYYWIISKGYRFRPWKSPYIQWRLETFFGHEAANLDAECAGDALFTARFARVLCCL